MAREETKEEEKTRMISQWDYYQKPNGIIIKNPMGRLIVYSIGKTVKVYMVHKPVSFFPIYARFTNAA